MSGLYLTPGGFPDDYFRPTVEFLLREQRADGSIPWFQGGHADPWDMVEAAMGLAIGGELDASARVYAWLRDQQLPNGAWWSFYKDGETAEDPRIETNFVAYVATGVWQHYLISRDNAFLQTQWPMVKAAIDFVLQNQTEHGDIHWAISPDGTAREDALITGCSSIYKSLECAINIAVTLNQDDDARWFRARERLGHCLRQHPERFDRTWESKERFSMDWFYPVLTGAVPPSQARRHLARKWDRFVENGLGCRCVSDQPWVTIAESCELTLALLAAGDHARAVTLYSWLHQWREEDGSYWTGYQFVEDVLWPEERPTWTAGAVLLAADALTGHTAASQLFTHVALPATKWSHASA